jgi:hypothetical protein
MSMPRTTSPNGLRRYFLSFSRLFDRLTWPRIWGLGAMIPVNIGLRAHDIAKTLSGWRSGRSCFVSSLRIVRCDIHQTFWGQIHVV